MPEHLPGDDAHRQDSRTTGDKRRGRRRPVELSCRWGKKKGAPSEQLSIVRPRSGKPEPRCHASGADLDRGEDPGSSRRPGHETMRHWITSFRLLTMPAM